MWSQPGLSSSLARSGHPFYHVSFSHNQRTTTFRHPVTGQFSSENGDFSIREQSNPRMSMPHPSQRPSSMVSESSAAVTSSVTDAVSGPKGSKSGGKVHNFGKRDHAIKRNPNIPVVVRGWLFKQDSSGMRLWKRRWFVLSDFCLFYYKDSREETVLGSIPLPSYVVAPVDPDDHISRKYAFKAVHTGMRSYIYNRHSVIGSQAEHSGMRTYYFSADTLEDMNGWVRAMNQAALMQTHGLSRETTKSNKDGKLAAPQANHVNGKQKSPAQLDGTRQPGRPEKVNSFERSDPGRGERYGFRKDEGRATGRSPSGGRDVDAFSPNSSFSRAPSVPPMHKMAVQPEQNGGVPHSRGVPPTMGMEQQRKNTLAQVEHWVKVQKGDPMSLPPSEHTLQRRSLRPQANAADPYPSLPKASRHSMGATPPLAPRHLTGDYKYAHDRLSHLRMSTDERVAHKEDTVWQLYEWQQRQQFRYGSPTVPMYGIDPTSFRAALEVPRSVSVPPSPSDVPPQGPPPKTLSPRRLHTPAERVTVRPPHERPSVVVPPSGSPLQMRTQLSKTSQMERRSMPSMGYITHTVSTPSLHGKSADDTYMQLKKDLEYLDLKVPGCEMLKDKTTKPVKIAESDVDVKLSRLCEQDKILQDLETRIRTLKEDKDKLESVLDMSHQQMEQYRDQPAHTEKIAYQQRLLREDVVHIRAEISQLSTEMENAWNHYSRLETDLEHLREALQDQMSRDILSQQEKGQMRKELWRIEDVMVGLSSSKANYKVTIESIQNPERKLVPSVSSSFVPSLSMSVSTSTVKPPQRGPTPNSRGSQQPTWSPPVYQQPAPTWVDEDVPPRPPLPYLYSPDEQPPVVPPLPKEASVIRHTSVRGLKRQSDERRRDREVGPYINGDYKGEIRPYLSEPDLLGLGEPDLSYEMLEPDAGYQTLPSKGPASSNSRLDPVSFVVLRRGSPASGLKERPKSALERLYSEEPRRGARMSADEQVERMKRHQKALVRDRKRTLSQGGGTRASSSSSSSCPRPLSADLGSWRREQEFDLQLLDRAVQGEEQHPENQEHQRPHSDEWLVVKAKPSREPDQEPLDYSLDLTRELSKPQKVAIPERYVDSDPEEPLSPQEKEARNRKVERIKSILAKSSLQNLQPPTAPLRPEFMDIDQALQEQERIITISYTLASEASQKSKEVAERRSGGGVYLSAVY
ncbi:pleckstrin homology domain-containing family A member 7 isoform X2 [Brienomyrus brachyistius]|uniref:pleckstrin homology domain-containing family A member 7 isoform X2 n=2 Tax=Brienomyrus brachyistius TaxID=42636 RepID=UPI0020B1A612|nr:pleckstrin homology domain-containing family A member 7 isoform X2 [Brienomyrus brachyistius]